MLRLKVGNGFRFYLFGGGKVHTRLELGNTDSIWISDCGRDLRGKLGFI